MDVSMFSLHQASALLLLAAVAAGFLLVFSRKAGETAKGAGTIIGSLVLAGTVLGLGCVGYYGVSYWRAGVFNAETVKTELTARPQGMMSMEDMHSMMMNMGGMMGGKGMGGMMQGKEQNEGQAH